MDDEMFGMRNIAMAIITGAVIIGLNFIIPYYSQQMSGDVYVVEFSTSQYTEHDSGFTRLEGEVHLNQIIDADFNADTELLENDDGKSDDHREDQDILLDYEEVIDNLDEPVETPADNSWMEEKLRKYGDEIPEEDMRDFQSITSKLDMSYATSLLEDPGGEEGELRLKQYLRYKLSSYEYERAKELFFLYNYILLD